MGRDGVSGAIRLHADDSHRRNPVLRGCDQQLSRVVQSDSSAFTALQNASRIKAVYTFELHGSAEINQSNVGGHAR
jgi:hypothetical protein